MLKKKILFIDRDGTVLREPPADYQIDCLEKFEFMPGVIGALRELAEKTDYRLVMISNQDGLGTSAFPLEDFLPYQQLMLKTLEGEGVCFDEILIDTSLPEEHSDRRKPAPGMVEKYLNELLDRENSYVIGDRLSDMQLAANMGIRGIYIGEEPFTELPVVCCAKSWQEVLVFLRKGCRRTKVERRTSETYVYAELDLNGSGKAEINTGIAFFDHMLEQIARHGGVDLVLQVKGDLKVDEHHTIEDTAIVLGTCFREALGSKRGIERYGFALPMDESKAEVLLDFGGRVCLMWKADFTREYVGDFPTEMTRHFFASFCESSKCNLHIEATGGNTHHLIEAIFKAFARSLRMAIRQTSTVIPSSKGII